MRMDFNLDDLKLFLSDYVNTLTHKSKNGKGYICPLCGSGEGTHGTGAFFVYSQGMKWKCHVCQAGGDIYDLYQAVNACDRKESTKAVIAMYGRAAAVKGVPPVIPSQEKPSAKPNFEEYYSGCRQALENSAQAQAYLSGRGISVETAEAMGVGFDANWRSPTALRRGSNPPPSPRIIVPCNAYQYEARDIRSASSLPENEKGYAKMNEGGKGIFNLEALGRASSVVFVTEGSFDALSIIEAGSEAVALNSASNVPLFLKKLSEQKTEIVFALCLDNDDAGRKQEAELAKGLERLGISCLSVDVCAGLKDPNEALQKLGMAGYAPIVAAAEAEAEEYRLSIQKSKVTERDTRTGSGMVDSFLQAIQTRKYEPMSTGIADIDRALGGGFIRQQLILLGAAPGAGKTALAQWIFEGMAQRGVTSVYLNLEMSREQILARSFSRIAAKNGAKIRATDILQGYKWTADQRKAIMEAATEYRNAIAPRMIYNPDGVTPVLETILSYIEQEAVEAERKGDASPCVILDYLQIVGSSDPREESSSIIKRAMSSLKEYAMRHNTIVFVIMANNREANKSGDVTMESGRDTSALEYGADLQLGLAYTACLKRNGNKAKNREELTSDERKLITLKVTKARFANPNAEVNLHFDGETMTYTQISKEFDGCTIVDEPTPFDLLGGETKKVF